MSVPGGTVTFVFTDIEGSTQLLKRLGDGYAQVAADHRRLVRDAFRAHGGSEVDAQGDALFWSFPRARDAVAAAVAAQQALAEHAWPEDVDVRVRMGVHTGEPVVGEEGYVGLDVHRAARICAAGHGGQVLLSETTRALAGSALPEGVRTVDLGEHELKDVDAQRIYQLVLPGMPESFPPLRASASEPMDFETRLERSIEARLERVLEGAFDGAPPAASTRAALGGLATLVAVVAAAVVVVLLVRLAL